MTRDRRGWNALRIGVRLLAFNLLVVFVPVVGILYLDIHEARLLDAQERAMVQQARMMAAAVGGSPAIDGQTAQLILDRLGRRSDARVRVYDAGGMLVADSTRAKQVQPEDELAGRQYAPPSGARQRFLYRIGALLAGIRNGLGSALSPLFGPRDSRGAADQPAVVDAELNAALAGRYGAATRRTWGQRSLTLFTAVPVRHGDSVIGAVVVSQSTFRILQALYDVRLRVFQVVVASLAAAAVLTAIAAMTIVKPLRRLRRVATSLAERRGPLPTAFPGTARADEIGELARALEELTRRLTEHIALLEGFAADVSHEFKNPLAGIRAAAETIHECDDPAERQRFLALMIRDVERLERLVSGVRDLARIDGHLEQGAADVVDVAELVRTVVAGIETSSTARPGIACTVNGIQSRVQGDRESLARVFENLLSNAVSFAPADTTVEVRMTGQPGECLVSIADRGPGIPEAHLRRIFDRFFTYRPSEGRREHLGLGLAIAKRIVERHGGTISAANRPGGGAVFEVRFDAIT